MTRDTSTPALFAPYRGRRILVIGGTGFLGNVVLSLLMREMEVLGRLDVVVRRRPGMPAEHRFHERVLPGAAFDPVRERLGDRFDELVASRVRVLEGDLAEPSLGLDEATISGMEGDLDLVVNASGLVDFHAPLGRSYRTNILGIENLLALCDRTGAALVHTSTAFVAGERTGRVPETLEVGWFPRGDDLPHLTFDPEAEIADIRAELERIGGEMEAPSLRAELAREAVERHREANGVDPSEAQLHTAVRRALRDRGVEREVAAGRARAEAWGWPNVYTYSKSLGEQRIAASGVRATIVRPTIVESALRYPEPGWNRNATTTAPLIMLAMAGYRPLPAEPDHVIDIIPVDQVAWTMLAAGASLLEGQAATVHHAGTSHRNPFRMRRLTDLVGIYLHEKALDEGDGARAWWKAAAEPGLVDSAAFRRKAEWVRAATAGVEAVSARWGDRLRARRAREILGRLHEKAGGFGREIDQAADLWEMFVPFSHDLSYRFQTDNTTALAERYGADDGLPVFDPEGLDWRSYWLDVHIPGLRRWVLSDEGFGSGTVRARRVAIPLTERFAALAEADGHRRAASYPVGDRPYALTYREAWTTVSALRSALSQLLPDPSEARIAVATSPDTPWWLGLLAVTASGGTAILVPDGAEVTPPGCDGTLRVTGRRSVRWHPAEGSPADVRLEDSGSDLSPVAGGAVSFASLESGDTGEATALRGLASRLSDLGDALGLADGARVLVPLQTGSEGQDRALALLLPALLDRGATIETIPPGDFAEALRTLRVDAVVLTRSVRSALAEVGEEGPPAGIARIVDLAPAGDRHLRPWLEAGVAVVQAVTDGAGLGLNARRELTGTGDLEAPFVAVPPFRIRAVKGSLEVSGPGIPEWTEAGWRGREVEGGVHIQPRILEPGEPVPVEEVFRIASVSSVEVQTGEQGGVRVVVTPILDDIGTLQELRRRLIRDVARHNESGGREERVEAVAVSLNGDLPATDPPWIPTRTRRDLDDMPSVEEREAWAAQVLAEAIPPAALDFYRQALAAEPVDDLRLEAWERTLLEALRDGTLHAQAFTQRFVDEVDRARRPDRRIVRRLRRGGEEARAWAEREDPAGPLLPEPVSEAVRGGLGSAIRAFYRHGMKVTVIGRGHVPVDRPFLVVANHSSHLDGGLVKYALGPWGERVHALAAKDYFFGTPARRFLAHHFTRLIPTERTRVTSEWLRRAREVLETGDCVLIFPEGTRTPGAEVHEFKASLGTLVRTLRAPVLPIHISGTSDILPKGKALPRGRTATVRVGPPLEIDLLEAGLEDTGATIRHDRWIAETVRRAVLSVAEDDFWWVEGRRRPADEKGRGEEGDGAREAAG